MDKSAERSSSSKSPPPHNPNGPPSRRELVDMVRKAGISSGGKPVKKVPISYSLSEPSSPRKLFRRLQDSLNAVPLDEDSSSTDSISTLTSEDGLTESRDNLPESRDKKLSDSSIPVLVVSQDEFDDTLPDFRSRTGSQFYHESFSSSFVSAKPIMYFPISQSAQQLSVDIKLKKHGGIFRRLRNSFNKHKPISRTVSDKEQRKERGRRWIDHEDELDPVSRPSYFRHIGHVVKAGPGPTQTIELNKPPQGKFGIYISQGIDPVSHSKSIFVSRFYQENMSRFYASMLRPGDEIIALNGRLIRDLPVSKFTQILAGLETVQLTILPITLKNDN